MEFEELRLAVEKAELVDAHAHSIVTVDSSFPFINCFPEADGEAPSSAPHSLSFRRNLRDISLLYGTESTLDAVEKHRATAGLQSVASVCFKAARISAMLMDDGSEMHNKKDLNWHEDFVPFVGRILRIERFAEKILDQGAADGSAWTLDKFTKLFEEKLVAEAGDVCSLKSIAAYRSGLSINPTVSISDAEEGLRCTLQAGTPARISNKNLIDYIFTRCLEISVVFDLPMQIHTGFGDKGVDLRLANPLHLRAILEDKRFDKCRIVLLHASYPFCKEASYLASVYHQVHLDFGLAVPKLSVQGMVSSVKELLELAPLTKVMFSTYGYGCPETFYLGAKKAREVVFIVLRDACRDGDLSLPEAVKAARDILSGNATPFYNIKRVPKSDSNSYESPNFVKLSSTVPQTNASLVRVIWVDASGQHRCRVIPSKRFYDVVVKNGVGLTCACMGLTSGVDCPAKESGLTGTGEIRLIPDLTTKWQIPWEEREEMVLADMHLKPGVAWEYCPREALRRVSRILKDEFNLEMNAGFESEFYLLRSELRERKEEYIPIDSSNYCSAAAYDALSSIFHEILAALNSLNITVEQLHAEAGKGQFELVLGHKTCFMAADNLIFARETIRSVVRRHGILATFLPKYALDDIGSGSHVHLSLWQNGQNVFMASNGSSKHGMSEVGEAFMAGVLDHLPSILAFTAPVPNSYDRIQPNTWSGAYQCWGKENREASLRTACPPGVLDGLVSNFEIKSFDACANPHLGLAAVMAAGIDGLRRKLHLPEPIDTNPFGLEGKILRLPKSLDESLAAFRKTRSSKASWARSSP
ncbi:hypothetical protein SAY87_007440 [Trapa incisa]|uniref:GS catalytic domain-containing protein n=1 Tax=Trapa incisa TaxID=236973 RepID=A0AAN7QFJ1_9MYRT|nr:hypothetical protein SAY87_007440 [Trapa incisa]